MARFFFRNGTGSSPNQQIQIEEIRKENTRLKKDLEQLKKLQNLFAVLLSIFGTVAIGFGTNILTSNVNVSGWMLLAIGILAMIMSACMVLFIPKGGNDE